MRTSTFRIEISAALFGVFALGFGVMIADRWVDNSPVPGAVSRHHPTPPDALFAPEVEAASPKLSLSMTMPATGVTGKKISVWGIVRNESQNTVTLISPGDGSTRWLTTPMISLEAMIQAGHTWRLHPRVGMLSGCATVEPPDSDQIQRLRPGEAFSFEVTAGFGQPGTYRVAMTYENDPRSQPHWWEEHVPEVKTTRASRPVTLKSEPVQVTILPGKPVRVTQHWANLAKGDEDIRSWLRAATADFCF